MTSDELDKIFREVHADVYSPESIAQTREQIKSAKGLSDSGVDGLALTLVTNSELDKKFMFRVLAKALCNKQ